MPPSLMTTKQAATFLGVSASFLEKDRWAGSRIPFIRIGSRSIRYRMEDLASFIQARSMRSTSEYANA